MSRKVAVWVKFDSRLNAAQAQYKAVTAHIECYDLSAEISEQDPLSIDIEFLHFDPVFLEELRKFPGAQDAGILNGERSFRKTTEIRKELERILRDLTQSTAA